MRIEWATKNTLLIKSTRYIEHLFKKEPLGLIWKQLCSYVIYMCNIYIYYIKKNTVGDPSEYFSRISRLCYLLSPTFRTAKKHHPCRRGARDANSEESRSFRAELRSSNWSKRKVTLKMLLYCHYELKIQSFRAEMLKRIRIPDPGAAQYRQ